MPEATPTEPQAARPRAGLLCLEGDVLLLSEKLDELGYEVQRFPTTDALAFSLVDIGVGGADEIIASASNAGIRVIAFGPDPDDMAQIRTRALGASVIVSRDELFADVAAHLPSIV
ncbi:MAG: hypothetical protein BMS9Abin12_0202 [Acidimicrobiia bacterium]|nr:MAG: hypothetical protein BMS9Abin12_0202 [Acidimicrobiia bacterium]